MKDLNGRFMMVNPQFEKVFGLERDKLIGRDVHAFFPAELARLYQANDRKALACPQPVQFEEIAPQSDGYHTYLSPSSRCATHRASPTRSAAFRPTSRTGSAQKRSCAIRGTNWNDTSPNGRLNYRTPTPDCARKSREHRETSGNAEADACSIVAGPEDGRARPNRRRNRP